MKNSEIALVVLIAVVSVIVSYWLGNTILGDPNNDTYKITYIDPISSSVASPDIETFNPAGLNPTVEVIIGTCKDGEIYDDSARKCVSAEDAKKKPDNPENPDPENPDPENPDPENPDPDNPEG